MLAVYVSGHGFGHTTRVGEVLRAVRARAPELPITVVTAAPEWLYRRAVPGRVEYRSLACDVGLVQRGALEIDEAGTAEACASFAQGWDAMVEAEARWLRASGASVVLGDVPPLAFAAAAESGVPSVALANFSWDWIYAHLAAARGGERAAARLRQAAADARQAYGRAGLLLRLPFAGDLSAFPCVEDVPLVARRPRVGRDEVRRRLAADDRPLVLLSFGGLGLPGFDASVLAPLVGYRFLLSSAAGAHPDNVGLVDAARLDALGLEYVDLVGAADVVVTKPGYGIVSDAIGAGTRLLYTERGDFPEYEVMVAEMPRYLACEPIDNASLKGGRLAAALQTLLGKPKPAQPALDGADYAARRLLTASGNARGSG